jgi:hypothetical protein
MDSLVDQAEVRMEPTGGNYNYLRPQNEQNILPVHEKKKPSVDPNINFGKAMLCAICFLGMYIAIYTAQNV